MRRVAVALALALAVAGALGLAGKALLRAPRPADPARALAAGQAMLASARRVVVVVAHPDDADWYAGGTLALLARRGAEVTVIVATDGERGPRRGVAGDAQPLGEIRRREQLAAAREIGYAVVFLGLPDRGLRRLADLPRRIAAAVGPLRPDVVLAFDARYPRLPYVHPDHQAVGRAVERLALAGDPAVRWASVYLFHTRRPDTAVNVSAAMAAKLRALAAHRSQGFGGPAGVASADGSVDDATAGSRRGFTPGAGLGPGLGGEPGHGATVAARHAAALGRAVGVGFAEVFRRLEPAAGPGASGEKPRSPDGADG